MAPPRLYPHQAEGVRWLQRHPFGCILAFAMRCGKSGTVLSSLSAYHKPPVLVVCPKSAIGVWRRETSLWRPDYQFDAPKTFRFPCVGEIVCITYERLIASGWPAEGTVLVLDEGHYIKAFTSLRACRARLVQEAILRKYGRTIICTATPLANKPDDLWNLLKFLGAHNKCFGSRAEFLQAFGASSGAYGTDWGMPRADVWRRLLPVVLHKTMEDALPWLQPVTLEDLPVEIDDGPWRTLANRCQGLLLGNGLDLQQAVARLKPDEERLIFEYRKELATAKIPYVLEVVEESEALQEPLVIFSAHRAPIDLLQKRKGWVAVHGGMTERKRTAAIDAFTSGKAHGIALTIQTGGMSIDLARAARILFVDPAWTPGDNRQAAARCSGPRQTRPVLVQFMVANHPVDTEVYRLVSTKLRIEEATFNPQKQKREGVHSPFSITQRWTGP